jgi:hypothetical protein
MEQDSASTMMHSPCNQRRTRRCAGLRFDSPSKRNILLIKDATGLDCPNGDFPMMKRKIVFWFVAGAAVVGMATAQNPKVGASSSKAGTDPLKTATKPLTPKTAIAPRSKTSGSISTSSANSQRTNAELTRLERQSVKAGSSKGGNAGTAKAAPVKSAKTSSPSGSGINASYQKPHVPQK